MIQTRSLDKFSSNILGMFVVAVEITSLLVLMIRISLGKLAWLPEESSERGLLKACVSLELLHLDLVGSGLFVLFPCGAGSILTTGYCCLIEKPQGLELIRSTV